MMELSSSKSLKQIRSNNSLVAKDFQLLNTAKNPLNGSNKLKWVQ